ncbi:uncharacterized protein LOC122649605 [Telopea speciosissima]|uniref:uncharacterized protein LOC122649605 n=1 Tax=Telopea speciosissima TaxID=54955 RepID=UPI001CC4AF0B|nr:uncharacterized protein LOC122649605 [Telopea speciosissima]
MASSVNFSVVEDNDLDDAELWAVIDSAAAASYSFKSRKPLALKHSSLQVHSPVPNNPSLVTKFSKNSRSHYTLEKDVRVSADGEVLQEPWIRQRPQKIARSRGPDCAEDNRVVVLKHMQRTPTTPSSYSSPDSGRLLDQEISPASCGSPSYFRRNEDNNKTPHSLSGQFPSVSLFKEYQNAAMAILEKSDYTVISGSPFIKKSGWRKISFYFNLSFEIKDKTIEFDENRNVQRAEFVVRAYMQGGRFSDGWGSCERREKRFLKPNHDIPSTAETRAKNKACQDLLGIGEYRPGATNAGR